MVRTAALALVITSGCFFGGDDEDPMLECATTADCGAGQLCNAGACEIAPTVMECGPMNPCPAGRECDRESGRCQMACPPGTRLELGRCVEVCTTNAECGDEVCVEGDCRVCVADEECGESACIAGRCEARCLTSDDCDGDAVCHRGVCGMTCEDDSSLCFRFVNAQTARVAEGQAPERRFARLGCQVSTERFVDPLCDGALPFERSPPPDCDVCLGSYGGCSDGQTCVEGDCTCATAADCPGGLACADGFCAPCAADDECGCDAYCSAGTCQPVCESDDDCPGTFVCAGGRCAGCRSDADCSRAELCFEDGCVEPCAEDDFGCRPSGRSTVCEVYEPIGDLARPMCE